MYLAGLGAAFVDGSGAADGEGAFKAPGFAIPGSAAMKLKRFAEGGDPGAPSGAPGASVAPSGTGGPPGTGGAPTPPGGPSQQPSTAPAVVLAADLEAALDRYYPPWNPYDRYRYREPTVDVPWASGDRSAAGGGQWQQQAVTVQAPPADPLLRWLLIAAVAVGAVIAVGLAAGKDDDEEREGRRAGSAAPARR